MMYSQSNEERVIADYFGSDKGSLLDIGAFDGRQFSNSLRLIDNGWTAVCIEPSVFACGKLIELHRDNPNVRIVNAAVDLESRWSVLYDSQGDAISTLVKSQTQRWPGTKYREVDVFTVTPSQVLDRFGGGEFKFLNIDVEGNSHLILQRFPLSMMEVKLVCVEHDGNQAKIVQYCRDHGLTRMLIENAENVIIGA